MRRDVITLGDNAGSLIVSGMREYPEEIIHSIRSGSFGAELSVVAADDHMICHVG